MHMHYDQIYAILKALGKSSDEIERTLDRVKEAKNKIEKHVRSFRRKVDRKYGMLSEADLIKKAIAYAAKGKLSETERDVFIKHVLHGNDELYYSGELKYSKMSQFLGYDTQGMPMLSLQAKDQAKLNELISLYNSSKSLYHDIRQQTLNYLDCSPEAISGSYKPDKHSISQHIHPIVAMLFLPSVRVIENRMLKSNIARMVLSRAPLVHNKVNLYEGIVPGDIEADFELGYAISQDPNSTNHFSSETPLTNLTNRFKCQIELWKNVLNLRSGRYYSKGYDDNDGISGFMKALDNFNRVQYDTVDNFNSRDEGNVLKKILAIFSIRPTYTQIYTSQRKIQMGFSNISGLSRMTFLNLPVINIRLPSAFGGRSSAGVHLRHALQQTDVFLKNKQLVPMNKSVMMSQDMIFFFADRKQRTVNAASVSMGFRNMALTPSFIGTTSLNKTPLIFGMSEAIGKEMFNIRGIITLQTPKGLDMVTGCAASVVLPAGGANADRGITRDLYLSYNPVAAGIKFLSDDGASYTSNAPISLIPERGNANTPGFRTEAFTKGCIFWYVKV